MDMPRQLKDSSETKQRSTLTSDGPVALCPPRGSCSPRAPNAVNCQRHSASHLKEPRHRRPLPISTCDVAHLSNEPMRSLMRMWASEIHTLTIASFSTRLSVSHRARPLCHMGHSTIGECPGRQRQCAQSVNISEAKSVLICVTTKRARRATAAVVVDGGATNRLRSQNLCRTCRRRDMLPCDFLRANHPQQLDPVLSPRLNLCVCLFTSDAFPESLTTHRNILAIAS
jgi:hypothetical protein